MNCLNPLKIALSDSSRQKRQSMLDMPLEYRYASHIYVPCGKCEACLTNRRSQWTFRLKQELKDSTSCFFFTLTYDDFNLPFKRSGNVTLPCVRKRDVQLFLKRLRKRIEPFKIRYFIVSEYGPSTFRPHYHGVIFNFPQELKNKLDDIINESWQLGFIRIDPITDGRIHYVTGYCLDNSQIPQSYEKNFMLCSRRPALGSNFLYVPGVVDYCESNSSDIWRFVDSNGKAQCVKLPKYYRERLFDDTVNAKISAHNAEYHSKAYNDILRRQSEWLDNNHIPISYETLHTAYPSSPYGLHLQSLDLFKDKVKRAFKIKKDPR